MHKSSLCRHRLLALAALWLAVIGVACATDTAPDVVLRGQLQGADNHTYREVPFKVPEGVNRITVQFESTGRDEHTTVDLGLIDPAGFHGQQGLRGWTGGSKQLFTVGAVDATPSFAPGPIQPGRWALLLGIPNIRPASKAEFTAKIWFGHPGDPAWLPAVLNPPLRKEAGWYRGDLHMHGAHSDGSCPTQSGGARAPCPLFFTVDDAAKRGLDFIALSDHNTISQANDIRELQPYFDRLLLIPAREITTFEGHANLFGTTEPLDFRLGSASVPDWNALLAQAATLHGVLSINHPIRPNDETCMGCGWTPSKPVDMRRVQAIEAVNGMDALSPTYTGIPFWQDQLNKGLHLTGIGGSDNHNAKVALPMPGGSTAIGLPTTVVHASELSMKAILDAIRAGHVFIDVQGSRDRLFDMVASVGNQAAEMGDSLSASAGSTVRVTMHATAMDQAKAEIIMDGKLFQLEENLAIHGAKQTLSFDWPSDGKRHWVRANVRDAGGALLIVGNPIYVN
ncbi:CehA/McbA family metallohydrolase [Dyella sp.]|uniref:CehA/McbA family metallohydrolase n=1 Tax=Dyella sp. TaxID=1869338 RepID=UPI002840EFC4|nr:CehA/McbA family metallohydrolase [Dyella sp.]MDR3445065.1 CehA/McbA family metallohydrolase [Dyella sp.]